MESCPYEAGYVHGKVKAHEELRFGSWRSHHADCSCQPCVTVRMVMAGVANGDAPREKPSFEFSF